MLYISSNTLFFSSFPRAAFIAFSQAHRAEIAEERRMREIKGKGRERSDEKRRWRRRYLFNRLRSILHRYWGPVLAVSTTESVRGRDKRRIMEGLERPRAAFS